MSPHPWAERESRRIKAKRKGPRTPKPDDIRGRYPTYEDAEERATWTPLVAMVERETVDPYSITTGHSGDDRPPEAVWIEEA